MNKLNHLPRSAASAAELASRFTDLHPALTPRQAEIESERCLYCYDAPCVEACPTGIDVPKFIRQIAYDNLNGAAKTILDANILGGSCARVCPTEILCERACVRNYDQEAEPVKIALLQRHAIDGMTFRRHPFERAPMTGKRIAVVGAGPAGLSCAHRLAMHGHDVVIFEAQAKPGGLNEYGIARYKLTDNYAQEEVAFLLSIGGIEIRYGQALGRGLELATLRREFDRVFLALGLQASRALALDESSHASATAATDYIRVLRQSADLTDLPVPASAIVIGAGNTAIDIAVQAKRLGSEEVTLVYRRGIEHMTATPHEQAIARDAGVRLVTYAQPERILLDNQGHVAGMRFTRTRLAADGRLEASDETLDIAAQAVFTAIGQAFDVEALSDMQAQTLARDSGRIRVNDAFRTSLPGVYAGGDCVNLGQDLTVEAVQHGKLAAEAIHFELMGKAEAA